MFDPETKFMQRDYFPKNPIKNYLPSNPQKGLILQAPNKIS